MTTFDLDEAEKLANECRRYCMNSTAAQLRAAIVEVKRLRERESKAREILQSLEWMCDDSHGFYVCEDCGAKAERKKFPNEQLAAWLKGAEDAG